MVQGHHGIMPVTQRPGYDTYRSPYGPNYKTVTNYHGINARMAMRLYVPPHASDMAYYIFRAYTAGGFAAVAGIGALYFFSDIPKVRKDIMQNIPVIGEHYVRDIPPSDNPF